MHSNVIKKPKTICLCHGVPTERGASIMRLLCLIILMPPARPISCLMCWTERWHHMDIFMFQHMLITFWPLSDKAMGANSMLALGDTANWMVRSTSDPQVAFASWLLQHQQNTTLPFQELCPAPCSTVHSPPFCLAKLQTLTLALLDISPFRVLWTQDFRCTVLKGQMLA